MTSMNTRCDHGAHMFTHPQKGRRATMVMGRTALQNPSCIAGHICLGMDQRGTVVVVTVRVRRVMAGLFVALAKERQIQSGRVEHTRWQRKAARELRPCSRHGWVVRDSGR